MGRNKKHRVAGLLGVAPASDDGHQRITRGDKLLVVGGDEQQHTKVREMAIKLDEKLRRRGHEVSVEEFHDIIREVQD